MLCMYGNRGEPHRPACQPTTGNLFMFHCCQVPVRRRPREELQTTLYCKLLPLAESGWGLLHTVSEHAFLAIQEGLFTNFSTHTPLRTYYNVQKPTLKAQKLKKKKGFKTGLIYDSKQINTNLVKPQSIKRHKGRVFF